MKNCYNSISRRALLDVVLAVPELAHLATFLATILAPEPALETRGSVLGSTSNGKVQGDPFSGDGVAIGLLLSLLLTLSAQLGVVQPGQVLMIFGQWVLLRWSCQQSSGLLLSSGLDAISPCNGQSPKSTAGKETSPLELLQALSLQENK